VTLTIIGHLVSIFYLSNKRKRFTRETVVAMMGSTVLKKIRSVPMKKHLLLFAVISSLFSSTSFAVIALSENAPTTVTLTMAPPSFPTAGQAFKKIYTGTLTPSDAQTQPWFESYKALCTSLNPINTAYSVILTPLQLATVLTNLQQKTITPEAATEQFQAAQTALKATADSVFSS
jgi:hypothetical protein